MKKRTFLMLLLAVMLVMLQALPASASSVNADVTIYGTQNYTQANTVLELVNEARVAEGLDPVEMDPQLMEYAMQRAAEVAVYYSHTRPDGTSCFTIMEPTHYYGYSGENIAAGYRSASAVMDGWMNSEGHRANILSSNFATMGVGCFYQDNGTICWVQLFSSYSPTGTYNKTGTATVSHIPITVTSDNLDLRMVGLNDDGTVGVYKGDAESLAFQLGNCGWSSASPVTMDGGYTLSVADTSIAKLNSSGTQLTGVKAGTTTMTVELGGGVISADIEVNTYATPTLECAFASDGNHEITWTDEAGEAYLYGYSQDEDEWYLLSYPYAGTSTCTNSYTRYSDTWVYVLRDADADGYHDVSERIVMGDAPDAPTVAIKNVASSGKIKLTWEGVGEASEYEVYRATSQYGNYAKLAATADTSYTDTSAEAGTTYYYKVKSVDTEGGKSDYSSPVSSTCDLPRPKVKAKRTASTGTTKLSWSAVEGAEEYVVYRASSKNGEYSKRGTTTKTTYSDSAAGVGAKYYYKVVAVHENSSANSAKSSVVASVCDLPRPTVTVKNTASTGKAKLSWNAIAGAEKYVVYRATSKSGEYKKLKTTTKTAYTDSSAEVGVKYYYKVVAVHENSAANSAKSVAVSAVRDLPRPEAKVSLNSKKQAKVKWGAVEGAEKYVIYRATSKSGEYTKLKTTAKTAYTDKKVKSGKTYYYKVVAVHETSSANSAKSTAVKIKVK